MSALLAQLGKNSKATASKSSKDSNVMALGLSDSDDDDFGIGTKTNKLPSKKVRTNALELSDDDSDSSGKGSEDDGQTFEDEKKRIAKGKVENLLAGIKNGDDDDESELPTFAELSKSVSKGRGRKGKRGKNAASHDPASQEDAEINNYLASRSEKKALQAKKQLMKEAEVQSRVDKDSYIEFLDLSDIPTATERERTKPARDSLEKFNLLTEDLDISGDSLVDMKRFAGDFDYGQYKEQEVDEVKEGGPGFYVKTRLNGNHEHVFEVSREDSWSTIRKVVSEYYSLKTSAGLKLKFDGQELKGNGCPDDEDMESGDLIDLSIKPNAYAAAVAAGQAKEVVDGRDGDSSSGKVKFRTRLNGGHEHKWRVSIKETFKKIKEKFADFYGLETNEITRFEIDGEDVGNGATPQDEDMEDDMLVDVKIPSGAYERAIAHVTAKKGVSGAGKALSSSSSLQVAVTSNTDVKKESRGGRKEVTFNVEVVKWVTRSGEAQCFQIKQFSDISLDSLNNSLIHKVKMLRDDFALEYVLSKDGQKGKRTMQLTFGKSLAENGIEEGSYIQVRPPSIKVIIKPSGISADGTHFVGAFQVNVNPVTLLNDVITRVLDAGYLIYPKDKLKFSLILEKGAPRKLNISSGSQDMRSPMIELGFRDNCELLVEKG